MDDPKAILKTLVALQILAITLLIVGIYVFSYSVFEEYGIISFHINFALNAINEKLRVFNSMFIYNTIICILTLLGFLAIDAEPNKDMSTLKISMYYIIAIILFYVPVFIDISLVYMICTPIAFILTMIASIHIRMGMLSKMFKDEFNDIQETFSQFEQKLENEDSINLPTYYYLKNEKLKLEKRNGWINIVNPHRATMVMGTPGSGKSFCFINPAIEQFLYKQTAMFLYDFKFPTQSEFAYNHFIWAKEIAQKKVKELKTQGKEVPKGLLSYSNAKNYVINFDSPAFSNRSNPLNAKFIKADTDAKNAAETIMMALNPESREKKDFFSLSATNLIQCIIMWLKDYENGKYCTFAHVVEFLSVEIDELFPILMSKRSIESVVKPFADAFKEGATDQLQGQVASAKMPLVAIAGENMWWICTGNDFELDVSDRLEPKLLCMGNNPEKKETYAPLLALYTAQAIKQLNKQGKLHSAFIIDELPTLFINGLGELIATARSNKVAVMLGIQDNSQLETGYGKTKATEIVNTVGNVFSGQVQGETAKFISNFCGKNEQQTESITISAEGTTSKNISKTRDLIIPENKVSNLSQGFFVGKVADDFKYPMDKKVFHCKVDIDTNKLKADEKKFVDLPIITKFDKYKVDREYYNEIYNEYKTRFAHIEEMSYMVDHIIDECNEDNVYEINLDKIDFKYDGLSDATKEILLNKFNVEEFTKGEFRAEIKAQLVDYFVKELCEYDFIQPMGKRKGNKNRFYVTVFMKSAVRANFYKIKDEIKEVVATEVNRLLNDDKTIGFFREEYLQKVFKDSEE